MSAAALRLVQKLSATRTFARIAPHVVPSLDRTVHRLTGGRVLLSARMLPGLILTAKGARSGRLRRTPLACMPEKDGTWILIGSNFGRPGHPSWTANLLKNPEAQISWRGTDIPVRATLLEGRERDHTWQAALAFWPPYAAYQSRITREIRLFRLERR